MKILSERESQMKEAGLEGGESKSRDDLGGIRMFGDDSLNLCREEPCITAFSRKTTARSDSDPSSEKATLKGISIEAFREWLSNISQSKRNFGYAKFVCL